MVALVVICPQRMLSGTLPKSLLAAETTPNPQRCLSHQVIGQQRSPLDPTSCIIRLLFEVQDGCAPTYCEISMACGITMSWTFTVYIVIWGVVNVIKMQEPFTVNNSVTSNTHCKAHYSLIHIAVIILQCIVLRIGDQHTSLVETNIFHYIDMHYTGMSIGLHSIRLTIYRRAFERHILSMSMFEIYWPDTFKSKFE